MKKRTKPKFFWEFSCTCKRLFSFFSLLLAMSILFSGSLSAQGKAEKRISIHLEEVSVLQALYEINLLCGNIVSYKEEEVMKEKKKVTLKLEKVTVLKAVETCLEGTGLVCKQQSNGKIIVGPRQEVKSLTITGVVMDKDGNTLPGATVMVRGSEKMGLATATDVNGKYVLTVPANAKVLLISFVGYKTQTVNIDGKTKINITLDEDMQSVDEVVVTGLVTRKASSFTGAASSFSREDLKIASNQNVLKALRNLDPSFNIVDNLAAGSNPNVMPEIQIRGTSGLPDLKGEYGTNPNQPLFILDGFETTIEKVYDLDMNRVESVTILKDAAAKALYGSKAGNGVVVIETIRPEAGRIRIGYNGSLALQIPDLSSYNLCNAEEKLQAEVYAGMYQHVQGNPYDEITRQEAYNRTRDEVERGVNTYWLSKPLRTQVGQIHSLNISGGDQRVTYGLNAMYNQITGVMKGSDRKTFSGGFDLIYRYKGVLLSNRLSVGVNKATESNWGSFRDYAKLNPYLRIRDENGEINKYWYQFYNGYSVMANPMYNSQLNDKNFTKYTDITDNLSAEWKVKDFRFTGRFSYTQNKNTQEKYISADNTCYIDPYSSYYGTLLMERGEYSVMNEERTQWATDFSMNYSREFGKHLLFFNATYSMDQQRQYSTSFGVMGIPTDAMAHVVFGRSYSKTIQYGGGETTVRNMGIVGILNYAYDNRFLLDATYRRNGSSQFGSDKRFANFWSFGLGWNIHNEPFFKKHVKFVNNFKIRGSWGYTGNQNYSAYMAMAVLYYETNSYYNGFLGALLKGLPNHGLVGQKKFDENYGVDLAMFKNRLNVRFDYYISTTENMLTDVTAPPSMGFTTFKDNMGKTQNIGYDLTFNYRVYQNVKTQSSLNVFLNFNNNKNKILNISKALESYNKEQDDLKDDKVTTSYKEEQRKPSARYVEGASINTIWAVPSAGIDPNNGREVFIKKDGSLTYQWSSEDQIVCGNTMAKVMGNFGLNMEYKGIRLNLTGRFRFGGQMYNSTLIDKVENTNMFYNVDRRVLYDRWHEPGDKALFKSARLNETTRPSSRFVMDLNEVYLTAITLGYTLPTELVSRWGLERITCSLSSNDIYQWSSVGIERGLDYPFARNLNFQVSVTF